MSNKNITHINEGGKSHGHHEIYYPNGQLNYKGNYNNGLKHGYHEMYYKDGSLWSKGTYLYGRCDGWWESYNSDGTPYYKGLTINRIDVGYAEYDNKIFNLV